MSDSIDDIWLPDLKGSPRQVGWAEKIRPVELKKWKASMKPDDFHYVTRVNDSTWWIANRGAQFPKMPTAEQRDDRILNTPADRLKRVDAQPNLPDITDERPAAAQQLTEFVADVGNENLLLKTAALAMAAYATSQKGIRREAELNLKRCEDALNSIKIILRNAT